MSRPAMIIPPLESRRSQHPPRPTELYHRILTVSRLLRLGFPGRQGGSVVIGPSELAQSVGKGFFPGFFLGIEAQIRLTLFAVDFQAVSPFGPVLVTEHQEHDATVA